MNNFLDLKIKTGETVSFEFEDSVVRYQVLGYDGETIHVKNGTKIAFIFKHRLVAIGE